MIPQPAQMSNSPMMPVIVESAVPTGVVVVRAAASNKHGENDGERRDKKVGFHENAPLTA